MHRGGGDRDPPTPSLLGAHARAPSKHSPPPRAYGAYSGGPTPRLNGMVDVEQKYRHRPRGDKQRGFRGALPYVNAVLLALVVVGGLVMLISRRDSSSHHHHGQKAQVRTPMPPKRLLFTLVADSGRASMTLPLPRVRWESVRAFRVCCRVDGALTCGASGTRRGAAGTLRRAADGGSAAEIEVRADMTGAQCELTWQEEEKN